jgi:hypothetical protein
MELSLGHGRVWPQLTFDSAAQVRRHCRTQEIGTVLDRPVQSPLACRQHGLGGSTQYGSPQRLKESEVHGVYPEKDSFDETPGQRDAGTGAIDKRLISPHYPCIACLPF